MLKNTKGSIDGFTVKTYIEGKEYMIPESLGDVFVDMMEVAIALGVNNNKPETEITNKTIKVPMPIKIETPESQPKIKKQVPKKKQPRKRKVNK